MTLTLFMGMPLIASWVNAMLYATELSQAICIWEELSDARWRTKLVVAIAVFVDTAATLVVCAQVWIVQGQLIAIPSFALPPPPTVNSNTTLPGLGNSTLGPPALDRSQVTIQWTYPTIIATTGITGFIVHAYLLHRIYTLTRNYVVVLPIALAALAAFVGAVLTVTAIGRFPQLSESTRWDPFSRTWEISSACTDILLAAVLIHTLRKVQSPFKATQTLIRQLIRSAVETGATTSALFVVIVILLISPAYEPIAVALQLIVGRAYTNTLLYNLRIGQRVRAGSSITFTASGNVPPAFSLSEIEFRRRTRRTENGVPNSSQVDADVEDSEVHRSTSASYGHADAYLDFPRSPRSDRAKKAVDTI